MYSSQSLAPLKFISFDVETTGTVPGVDRIIEVGAIKFEAYPHQATDWIVTTEIFSTLVDPETPIPSAASRINGISDDMVRGKPKIQDLLEPLAQFCGDIPLVAHNAPFDVQFLTADMKRFEISGPQGCVLDTFAIAKKVFPGLQNYRLSTLIEHLKLASSEFHRAEQDALYCGQVLVKILEKISRPGEIVPMENLLALSGRNDLRFPKIERMPKQLDLLSALL